MKRVIRGRSFSISASTGEREEAQMVCAGKEFRLPVYSTSRMVFFTPDSDGPRRVLLDKTTVSGSVSLLVFFLCCVSRFLKPVYCATAGEGAAV